MKNEWFNVRLIIFDLDGTLYEDTNHFEYFASLLKQMIPSDRQAAFESTYRQILAGDHPVSIGKAYDLKQDAVLTLDPITLRAASVCDWDGNPWTPNRVQDTYPEPVTLDFENIVAIGDGWWLPFAVAKHYGAGNTYPAYVKTKEYLTAHEHLLTRTPGLRSWLEQQGKSKSLVLVTNSEQDDVQRLLSQLDLSGVFHQVVTDARKPAGTTAIFQNLLKEHGVLPEEAVSIGDNFLNEVAPALHLGMKAVLLQPTPAPFAHDRLWVVRSIRDLF
ncbi:HAD family hydrolase [Desmospora profundinema]|uniref:Hydrolase of the HAD superfamily n=1 Tax=Desmospora profundinema TaxID=1571184 RepID=A0ABU1ILY8_9BACL|nr:HAD family hydrolase [Desmospora profundinema]MDR6225792.1 putative hydrolase of the HAD superfamily [Desmospora profundinema]